MHVPVTRAAGLTEYHIRHPRFNPPCRLHPRECAQGPRAPRALRLWLPRAWTCHCHSMRRRWHLRVALEIATVFIVTLGGQHASLTVACEFHASQIQAKGHISFHHPCGSYPRTWSNRSNSWCCRIAGRLQPSLHFCESSPCLVMSVGYRHSPYQCGSPYTGYTKGVHVIATEGTGDPPPLTLILEPEGPQKLHRVCGYIQQ